MSVHHDRRDAKSLRVPCEAIVEVGGELDPGTAFEAQSVDVSVSGMHLRTAYLPEVGQPLLCRFGSGAQEISAEAEVVWRREEARGGEFGIRFTNLDGASAAALWDMCGMDQADRGATQRPGSPEAEPGTRVRLHIDGLGSPMKARVRGATTRELLVGSNLEFLRVGRSLELEDVDRGGKRPAHIDRVDIEMDRDSRVPQLVVTLCYDDIDHPGADTKEPGASTAKAGASPAGGPATACAALSAETPLRGRFAAACSRWEARIRGELAKAGFIGDRAASLARLFASKMTLLGVRAKTTAGLLLSKARETAGEKGATTRRTTSPPPSGALHATGKRVVRLLVGDATDDRSSKPSYAGRRAMLAIGAIAAVLVPLAAVLLVALHKPGTPPASFASSEMSVATATVLVADANLAAASVPVNVPPAAASTPPAGEAAPLTPGRAVPSTATAAPLVPTAAASFGHGKLTNAVMLQVKMNGPIAAIHGTRAPTGFVVVIPGRRTTDSGALLARFDARLLSVKVSNGQKGSELSFTFRDAVPAYAVRARGDRLQVSLGRSEASPTHRPIATRTTGPEHARAERRRSAP